MKSSFNSENQLYKRALCVCLLVYTSQIISCGSLQFGAVYLYSTFHIHVQSSITKNSFAELDPLFLSVRKDGFKNISKLTLQSLHEICHNSRASMGYVDLHKNSYHFHHDGWAVFPLLATKWNYSTSPDIFHCSFFVLLKLKDLVAYDLDIPL